MAVIVSRRGAIAADAGLHVPEAMFPDTLPLSSADPRVADRCCWSSTSSIPVLRSGSASARAPGSPRWCMATLASRTACT